MGEFLFKYNPDKSNIYFYGFYSNSSIDLREIKDELDLIKNKMVHLEELVSTINRNIKKVLFNQANVPDRPAPALQPTLIWRANTLEELQALAALPDLVRSSSLLS